MNFPVYQYLFTVSDKHVLPAGPMDCGTAGDHNATRLTFTPLDPTAQYRVEIVTAGGVYDVTETLTPIDGEVSVDVPQAWTTAGIATVRLVEVATKDGEEVARRYFAPVTLRFAYREEGVTSETTVLCWQALLTRAEAVLTDVSARMATAEAAAVSAASDASSAASAAEAAAPHALAAETAAARCEEILADVEELTGITASIQRTVGV